MHCIYDWNLTSQLFALSINQDNRHYISKLRSIISVSCILLLNHNPFYFHFNVYPWFAIQILLQHLIFQCDLQNSHTLTEAIFGGIKVDNCLLMINDIFNYLYYTNIKTIYQLSTLLPFFKFFAFWEFLWSKQYLY